MLYHNTFTVISLLMVSDERPIFKDVINVKLPHLSHEKNRRYETKNIITHILSCSLLLECQRERECLRQFTGLFVVFSDQNKEQFAMNE